MITWEHQTDNTLNANAWAAIAADLAANNREGMLMIDEAHSHLQEINLLVDMLASRAISALKLILISTRNHWNPRIKTPNIFHRGREFRQRESARPTQRSAMFSTKCTRDAASYAALRSPSKLTVV